MIRLNRISLVCLIALVLVLLAFGWSRGHADTLLKSASILEDKTSRVMRPLTGSPVQPDEPPPFPESYPIASLITIGSANLDGSAVISGVAGTVEPLASVVLASPDTGRFTITQALADGSFQTDIFAPPGAWVQVKQAYEVPDTSLGGEQDVSWFNVLPGTMVRAEVPVQDGEILSFAGVGPIRDENGDGSWMAEGFIFTETVGLTTTLYVSGTLRVTSPAITAGTTISDGDVIRDISLRRYFTPDGRRTSLSGPFASTFSTPTGLPISREGGELTPISQFGIVTGWSYAGEQTMEAPISITLPISAGLLPGYYRPYLVFGLQNIPTGPAQTWARPGSYYNPGAAELPVIHLGQSEPPRLVWTLLSNSLSNATRGTVAREDKAFFGLMSHIVTQAEGFVVPRFDPRTVEPIVYRLEPFMPMIARADRGVSGRPTIPFQFPSGSLQVTIRHPDGTIETLGPAPFLQAVHQGLSNNNGKSLDIGGGRIDDLYQLTTLDNEFGYEFQGYGHYVITMTGTIEDIWGNVYEGSGTYDVTVARPLLLDPGQLPTTPYQVGNHFAPSIHVYPPVPADVEIHLLHMTNSDLEQMVEHFVAGQANRFGYFQPPPGTVISMTTPGEFRVNIFATFEDPNGTFWMGSATWGNVVETPSSPIIAHGRRGLDLAGPHDSVWFSHRLLGVNGPGIHSMYPYWSGDILWGNQTDDWCGGDAIIPAISLQDPVGEIQAIVEQRWADTVHSDLAEGPSFEERVLAAEIPLFSTTSDGNNLAWSPDLIDQYGYAYRSSERPGIRVHETIAEDALGIGYWRFNAEFGLQAGVDGDLPNDLKWQFAGTVFRVLSETNPINEYAIYGSLWVLLPDNDTDGSRVMPPFRGAASGPDGGPIMVLQEEIIDIFFLPKGVQPGDVLAVGDIAAFSGHVGPPLNSEVAITVTSPGGDILPLGGQANKIGWFYDPGNSILVAEPGVWTVETRVTHNDLVPSTGLAPTANNTGSVLGATNGRYHFYAVDADGPLLPVVSPQPGFLEWTGEPLTVTTVPITVAIPPGFVDPVLSYTIRIPGFILDQGTLLPSGDVFAFGYDPIALHQDFPNLDLHARDTSEPGLADRVVISLLLFDRQGEDSRYMAGMIYLDAEEVFVLAGALDDHTIFLPLVIRNY